MLAGGMSLPILSCAFISPAYPTSMQLAEPPPQCEELSIIASIVLITLLLASMVQCYMVSKF